ncbi:sodium:proton antiporter [Shewanella corallii]|uniref:Sodium:proton antiporter n=1 Tax=Shewanella corallii TaxID=560080 RepID=A0ABT0ND88_9GAMM|nr:sodium:proton antiporter [Shewanella corallii]
MSTYHLLCLLAAVSIFIAYFNQKFSKVQNTIAITAAALMISLAVALVGQFEPAQLKMMAGVLHSDFDFSEFLLSGILGFLLFAGALGIKLNNMKDQKWEIAVLALVATLTSTFLVGFALYGICNLIGVPLDLVYCLLFGALISPTDPIAVLAIVKKLHAPQRISTQIEGESLFNDGFGLVIFVTIFTIAFGTETPTIGGVTELFLVEAIGGIFYGILLGALFHWLIKGTDDPYMELLLTLLVPSAGYAFAEVIGVSGPLAMVMAGILIGNITREQGLTDASKVNLNHFWELVDEFLNGILFLMIGLAMLTFVFHWQDWIMMAIAIPLVLACRYISIKFCYLGLERFRIYNPMSVKILTWGGLRGGLALAMAMSVPAGVMVIPDKQIDVREILLVMTYAVVLFSILVQGSTITPMIEKAKRLE